MAEHSEIGELFLEVLIQTVKSGKVLCTWTPINREPGFIKLTRLIGDHPMSMFCEHDITVVANGWIDSGLIKTVTSFEDVYRQIFISPTYFGEMDKGARRFNSFNPQWSDPATTVYGIVETVLHQLHHVECVMWRQFSNRD